MPRSAAQLWFDKWGDQAQEAEGTEHRDAEAVEGVGNEKGDTPLQLIRGLGSIESSPAGYGEQP